MGLLNQGGASAPSTPEPDNRCWGYRNNKGEVEGKIFNLEPNEKLPKGWVDTPAKVKL